MGVRINGVWHEELADPGSGGSDSGNGRNYTSGSDYTNAVGHTQMGNVNTTIGGGGTPQSNPQSGAPGGDLAAYYDAISGFQYDQLAQNDAQFKARLQLERDQLERLGIPQLALQKWQAEKEDEHFQAQMQLASRQQGFTEEMGRSNLGLQYLTQASQFAASDPFALSDFMHGAQANSNVPLFVRNLQNNVGPTADVGPPGQANAPSAITMASLGNNFTGGSSPYGGRADATQGAISDIYRRGPDQLAAGSLEGLDNNELNTLNAGLTHVGGSAAGPAFLQKYYRQPVRSQQATSGSYTAY